MVIFGGFNRRGRRGRRGRDEREMDIFDVKGYDSKLPAKCTLNRPIIEIADRLR